MGTLPWADGGKCPQGCVSGSFNPLRSFAGLSWALLFLSHPKPGRSSGCLLSHGPGDSFRALHQKVLSMMGGDGGLRQRGGSTALGGEGAHWLVGHGGTCWDILGHTGTCWDRLTAAQSGIPSPYPKNTNPGSPGYLSCEPYFLMDCAFKPYFMLLES